LKDDFATGTQASFAFRLENMGSWEFTGNRAVAGFRADGLSDDRID
jgi:hypothetical protein